MSCHEVGALLIRGQGTINLAAQYLGPNISFKNNTTSIAALVARVHINHKEIVLVSLKSHQLYKRQEWPTARAGPQSLQSSIASGCHVSACISERGVGSTNYALVIFRNSNARFQSMGRPVDHTFPSPRPASKWVRALPFRLVSEETKNFSVVSDLITCCCVKGLVETQAVGARPARRDGHLPVDKVRRADLPHRPV